MSRLIVNADDFGLHPSVNEAIVKCHTNGIVTSTSLLASGNAFNDAVSLTIFSAIDNTEFVKFITEVQDKNSKIMSLAEMMILRDLMDNRKEQLSELSRKVQKSLDETKKSWL